MTWATGGDFAGRRPQRGLLGAKIVGALMNASF